MAINSSVKFPIIYRVPSQSAVIAVFAFSCGQKKATDATASYLGSKPADSQGKLADIQLKFASTSTASLALATTLNLGGGVSLSDARVNIGKIKIKPEKDKDQEENEKEEKAKASKASKHNEMKDEENTWDDELKALEKKYEGLLAAASSDADKKSLKESEKKEKAAIEAKVAATEKSVKDKLDSSDAEQDKDIKWKDSYVYDLLQNTITPAVPTVSLLDGTYRRIEFDLRPNRVLATTDALLNNSVYLAGNVLINSVSVPFTYSSQLSEKFRLAGTQGASVEPNVLNSLLISFNPSLWLSNLDFSLATKDASGTIAINDKTNVILYNQIKTKIKISTKFGKDKDGDGKLAEGENNGQSDGTEGE